MEILSDNSAYVQQFVTETETVSTYVWIHLYTLDQQQNVSKKRGCYMILIFSHTELQ